MNLTHIHSFLVKPEKRLTEESPIKGTTVPNSGNLHDLLKKIFVNAPHECEHNIAFQPNAQGAQINDCKNLFTGYMQDKSMENGRLIAARLQSLTTGRSGLGLLFLMSGERENVKRFVISRFPADSGILADEHPTSLTVQFVEKIFMRSAKAYKSAFYEGRSPDADFWLGKSD